MEIKVEQIYQSKITNHFIKIKEITYYDYNDRELSNSKKQMLIANIVYSGECQFLEDTNTTCSRGIIDLNNFLNNYSEIENNDMGKTFKAKLVKIEELRKGDYIIYCGNKFKI